MVDEGQFGIVGGKFLGLIGEIHCHAYEVCGVEVDAVDACAGRGVFVIRIKEISCGLLRVQII